MTTAEKTFKHQVESAARTHGLTVQYHKDNIDRSEDRKDEITIDAPDGKHFHSGLHCLVIAWEGTGSYRTLWASAYDRIKWGELPLEDCTSECEDYKAS